MRLHTQRVIPGFFFVLFLTLIAAGCSSHKTPYLGETGQSPTSSGVPEEQIMQRVLLVGDAGEPKIKGCDDRESCEPVLDVMEHWAQKRPGGRPPFTVFLGDNIYPGGLPNEDNPRRRLRAERKLNAQTSVLVNSQSRGILIPGNHDWGGTFGGYPENWVRQFEYLQQARERQMAEYGQAFVAVPDLESGCPWPISIDETELRGVTIIVMDTQWWLTPDDMKGIEACERTSAESIKGAETRTLAALDKLLREANGRHVIVATHHPMASHGVHGGSLRFFTQDLRGNRYQRLIKAIEKVYYDSGARPLIHAAGHDHALQVLRGDDKAASGTISAKYNLVSGAGSQAKVQPVGSGDDTMFAHQSAGFMIVDFMRNGDVFLQVIEPDPSDPSNLEGIRAYATRLQ